MTSSYWKMYVKCLLKCGRWWRSGRGEIEKSWVGRSFQRVSIANLIVGCFFVCAYDNISLLYKGIQKHVCRCGMKEPQLVETRDMVDEADA